MLRYAKLCRRPRLFPRLTGLSKEAFDRLARRLEPCWEQAERRRRSRPDRRHGVGGGRPYKLTTAADKLLLFLALCRQGLTYELAGLLFDLDATNVRILFLRLAPAVTAAADPQLRTFLVRARRERHKTGGKRGRWEDFARAFPELVELSVDTTEQPRRRPGRKDTRKRYYSGKRRRFTLKSGVVVTARGRILKVLGTYPGPTPDLEVFERERLAELIPKEARTFLDLGFQGVAKAHPDHDLRLPYKRSSPGCKGRGKPGPPLTRGHKQANGLRSRRRVVVEHRIGAIKGFALLADPWRSRPERHHEVFTAVAAVTNFRLAA